MQDNDLKHNSRYDQWWYTDKEINWRKTPASSPGLNPIELVWHTIKEYLHSEYKPHNLSAGIKWFWSTLTPERCSKDIGHLNKVIPKAIEVTKWLLVLFCLYIIA